MKNMINKRVLAVLMAIAVFFTCSPALSYAFTEMPESIEKAAEAEETAEDIATLEAEEGNTAVPETETEDADSQPEAAGISAVEPDAAYQDASADIDDLLSGLEAAEGESDWSDSVSKEALFGLEESESKEALDAEANDGIIKAEDIRVFGSLRYDTAIEVAERYKSSPESKFKNVIVANGINFPDALSGGYLAKVKNAPILLVGPSVESKIVNYIKENIASDGTVYILGGIGVVSKKFEDAVKAKGISTTRLGGKDRFETNIKILKEANKEVKVKPEDIMICSTIGYADSLSASAVGKPILLVGNTLTTDQKNYLKGLKKAYLIGGEGVVSRDINTGLKALGLNTERLGDADRYRTSKKVAERFFPETKTVVLVYAQNFPDGLSGGPLAMKEGAPIILTDSITTNNEWARLYVKSAKAFRSITLGGPTYVSYEAVERIMGRTNPYINVGQYTNIQQIGNTAKIKIESNYGTKHTIKNSDVIEVVSKDITYNEKGEPIETITVRAKKNGTAVIVFNDAYSGSVSRPSATKAIIINVGEISVKNLYNTIDMTGYINKGEAKKGEKDRTVELSKTTDKTRIFLVNHTESRRKEVELVCAVQNGSVNTYSAVMIPLDSSTAYPVYMNIENRDEYVADVYQSEYTNGKNLSNTKEIIIDESILDPEKFDYNEIIRDKNIIPGISYNEYISDTANNSITAAFKSSMASWNSALKSNYGIVMKNLGFTKY